jgi:Ca-activated chloride channel family protein
MTLSFAEPRYLPLVAVPVALLVAWIWRFGRRRADLSRMSKRRTVPVRERFRIGGELPFWLFQLAALALVIVSIARPVAPTAVPRRPGLDIVVLQDASASMRVGDVARTAAGETGSRRIRDRWQRSMQFLRELGDALSWHEDRIAVTAFAHIAAPQIRLTRDPNTLFFFLDHLYERPPFRLEDETTWDTNLELGVRWGLRIVEKDEEIHGRSSNARLFVMLSDGETWSGRVQGAIAASTARGIPIYVVGVGTLGGGPLPVVDDPEGGVQQSPGVSRLERGALQRIASAGRGEYFELDRDGDRYIANAIVSAGRRLAPSLGLQESASELYWWFLCAAAGTAGAGLLFLRKPVELGLMLGAGVLTAVLVGPLLF